MFEQKINQIKERILLFVDYKEFSKREFCKILGINPSHLGKSNLKSDFGGDAISKILLSFPEINPEWLLIGKGEMLKNEQKIDDVSHNIVVETNISDKERAAQHSILPEAIAENSKKYQEIIQKQQEQMDKLIDIIAKLNETIQQKF